MRFNFSPEVEDTLFAVSVETEPSIVIGEPEVVLAADLDGVGWDLHPDGERFIVTEGAGTAVATPGEPSPTRYLIVRNWFTELRSRTGG